MSIPPIQVPDDATCQEASVFSRNTYIPCGLKANSIVYHARDGRGYYMCHACASHNVANRGGKYVTPDLSKGRT
jgi:hypothetical protein